MNKVSKENIRILYMGTPKMSADVLNALISEGYNVIGLICQEDKEVGRKHKLSACPTKCVALEHNIPCYQPHKIRLDFDFVKELNPDLILTMAYGQIVPQGLLDIPRLGCLNFHGSLLPKYRGAAPIQRAILNGEKVSGVTLMEMVQAMDAGKMYSKDSFPILEDDNFSTVSKKIVDSCINIIKRDLPLYLNGELKGEEQDESLVSIANKIKPEDEKLDLSKKMDDFIHQVNALADEPGGYLIMDEKKFKILKVKKTTLSPSNEVGALFMANKKLYLNLVDGVIELLLVQMEGKKVMPANAFLCGHQDCNKKILS